MSTENKTARRSTRPPAPQEVDQVALDKFLNGAIVVDTVVDGKREEPEAPEAPAVQEEKAAEAPAAPEYPWDAEEDKRRNTGNNLLFKMTDREKMLLKFLAENSPNSQQEWITAAFRAVLVEQAERCFKGERVDARQIA